jgi:pimeloyl-ACP methyl ester carboxylesterase
VGHEYARSQFVLQNLANRLAIQGVPTLRFDYHGVGDAHGESGSGGCLRWQEDIVEACEELRHRTDAEQITVVGARLGATLASNVLGRLRARRLVLWDPVVQGDEYRAGLSRNHRRYLRGEAHLRIPRWVGRRTKSDELELLGLVLSQKGVSELSALSLSLPARGTRGLIRWLVTATDLGFDCGWDDVAQVDLILPDVGITKALAALALEDA